MAKKSVIARNKKRMELVSKYHKKRQELKKMIINMTVSLKKRLEAQHQLARLPRDSSLIRVRNRCALTGRPRGIFLGVSRQKLRELASQAAIPGLLKSSW